MKVESKIGPMVLMTLKRIVSNAQNTIIIYRLLFDGAELGVTCLHAFTVVRGGKEIYLPANMLRLGDDVWVDRHSFMADGSFRKR